MVNIVPVILCGGSGTRLWPRSRVSRPKPFLPLTGERTLFEQTVGRCLGQPGFGPPVIVTGTEHLSHVEAQLDAAPDAAIIVEPAAKNTAAAIALAAHRLPDDAVLLVCPSDHHIGNCKAFTAAARSAAALAVQGWLVSFGIEANRPETGFGYVKRGDAIGDEGFRVAQFVEKPDVERAERFLSEGGYAWNGGIFAFQAKSFLDELMIHRPDIAKAVEQAVRDGEEDGRRFHPDPDAFSTIQPESVDYAVMENTSRAAMVPANMDWSDIGNWQALHAARPLDADGNSASGTVEMIGCRNVLVDSDGPRVSVIGLNNVIVVVDGNEVLVTTAEGAQSVGKLSGAVNQ